MQVDDLGRFLGRRWLFRHLEFELRRGDCLLITGPNGSGKSTLLRLLALLDRPTEGSVQIQPEQLGFAAIDQAMYPSLTCQEHVDFVCDVRGVSDPGVLDAVELAYAKDVPSQNLSSGMRSRLRLALSLVHQPNVLLLDEPSATLDAAGIDKLDEIIHRQLENGAVILATNDPAERRWATAELGLS